MKNCVDCKKWKCRCLYCHSRSEMNGKWYCNEVEDYCENANCMMNRRCSMTDKEQAIRLLDEIMDKYDLTEEERDAADYILGYLIEIGWAEE